MTDPRIDTVKELARMEEGEFHLLCDRVLPRLYPDMAGLKPNGVNRDGRTIKGTPDSYIGQSPSTCSIAVEYNVWAGRIAEKFNKDYSAVRQECSAAKTIVLVAAGLIDDLDTSALEARARADGIALMLVGGRDIAAHLDKRSQDLRKHFLNIPIGSHTRESLIARLAEKVEAAAQGRSWLEDQANLVPRDALDRTVMGRLVEGTPSWTLILGCTGAGKTTWAYTLARRRSLTQPTIWAVAKDLNFSATDPLGEHIAMLAYGAASPERIIELGNLLRWDKSRLIVVLDGIDEAPNYNAIGRALGAFKLNALYPHCHILLVCREEAWSTMKPVIVDAVPEFHDCHRPARQRLEDLREEEAAFWLQRRGATGEEARTVLGRLPEEFRGRPLFLRRGLNLLQHGRLEPGAPFGPALVDDFVSDICARLATYSPRPSESRVRRALGELAWVCMSSDRESVKRSDLEDPPTSLWADAADTAPLARAGHAGVLVTLPEDRIAFAHSLFQAAFAADCVAALGSDEWRARIEGLPSHLRRSRLLSLAGYLKTVEPLVEALTGIDNQLALECAAQQSGMLSPALRAIVLEKLNVLLGSRFRSDVRAGLKLLSRMSGPEAQRLAVTWFRGLTPDHQRRWRTDAADLFLRLEVDDELEIILEHEALIPWDGVTWFEPEIIRAFSALSSGFRGRLSDLAVAHLAAQEGQRTQAEILLALLHDPRLVEHLARKAEHGRLDQRDHRLLIHLNTPTALELYAESVQRWLDRRLELRGLDTQEAKEERSRIEFEVVLRQGDIPMYPHEQLLEVVRSALSSCDRRLAWFGLEWAAVLGDPSLLPSCVDSEKTLNHWAYGADRAVEATVRRHGVVAVRDFLTMDTEPQLRTAILEKLALCPGADSEAALLAALEWKDVRLSAVKSLGALRVVAAVPRICALLEAAEGWELEELVRVLGEIGHESAVAPLLQQLRRDGSGIGEASEDHGYHVCCSLAAIGGEGATQGLREALPGKSYEAHVLCWVLARADRAGLHFVAARLRAAPELIDDVVVGLSGNLEHDQLLRWYSIPDRVTAHISAPDLIAILLSAIKECANYGDRYDPKENPYRAAGRLDSPHSIDWLKSVARLKNAWGELDEQRRLDASSCAVAVLADLGVPEYVAVLVDRELEVQLTRGPWPFTDGLDRWPRQVVRERILRRMMMGQPNPQLAWLFSRYADSRDRDILLRLEASEDPDVADIAHLRIRWDGFVEPTSRSLEAL